MEVRLDILDDQTAHIIDDKNNLLFTIDPEEMSAAFVKLLSMGFYDEVIAMVMRMRELRVREAKFALECLAKS